MKTKDRRREVRLASEDDDLLVEAAGLAGLSVSEFLLDHALVDARALVDNHRTIVLGPTDHERFMAALDAPLSIPEGLSELARSARPLKHTE